MYGNPVYLAVALIVVVNCFSLIAITTLLLPPYGPKETIGPIVPDL